MLRPIAVDLFAGAGGLSLGFEQAGFDVVAAVELDPVHCAVHRFNFPDCAVIPRSVRVSSSDSIRIIAKIGRRKVHVVFGGPPCQGFSLIGHRAIDDPQNGLVRDFVRIDAELHPDYFFSRTSKGRQSADIGSFSKTSLSPLGFTDTPRAGRGRSLTLPTMVFHSTASV